MALRLYFTQFVGTGTRQDPFRSVIQDLVPVKLSAVDGRVNATLVTGWALVKVDATPAQHTILTADARVVYLPLEDATGRVVDMSETLGTVSAANRTTIRTRLEARHIPDDGITLSDTVGSVLRRIVRRFLVRQILGADDLSEGLDTLVSAIPVAKRQAIRTKLLAHGIDFDGVLLTDTVREAIRKIVVQNPRILAG